MPPVNLAPVKMTVVPENSALGKVTSPPGEHGGQKTYLTVRELGLVEADHTPIALAFGQLPRGEFSALWSASTRPSSLTVKYVFWPPCSPAGKSPFPMPSSLELRSSSPVPSSLAAWSASATRVLRGEVGFLGAEFVDGSVSFLDANSPAEK